MNIITPLTTQPAILKAKVTEAKKPKEEERFLEIRYLARLRIIYIKGWSFTHDIHDKYAGLMVTIDDHFEVHDDLSIFFKYHLFNCSTTKYLLNIIKVMNKYHKLGKKVKAFWSCVEAPEEMVDTGIDLREFCEFDFHINCV